MELVWSWIHALGLMVFLDALWTLPIAQEQRLQPEDMELAEGYLRRFYPNPNPHPNLRRFYPNPNPNLGRFYPNPNPHPNLGRFYPNPNPHPNLGRFYPNPNPNLQTGTGGRLRRAASTSPVEEKMREMQRFFGLKQTGALDPQTLAVMREARCGVPDVDNFSLYPSRAKWRNHTITYRIAQYTPDMKKEDVENSFRSALRIWSDKAPLTFARVNHGKADIVLHFARRTHGDFFPFDGPNGVLAHAFEPGAGMGGDVHFDEDETWTTGKQKQGYSLFAVAAHELGHSLGLSHSRDPSAVMYPNYKHYKHHHGLQHQLSPDDVLGIQTIYGKVKTTRKEEAPTISRKCDPSFSVDAVAVIERDIVFFKDRYLWMRSTQGGVRLLREGPSGAYLPGIDAAQLDAAYDVPGQGVAYIFTGHEYRVVQRFKMKSRAGSIYEYGFSSRVRRIDAALYVSAYGKTFFFVGDVYYRYDERKRKMESGFPRLIHKDWPGVRRRVDAAFELNGNIYLFSGTQSYQYDLKRRRIVNTFPAKTWLGC